MYSLGIDVGSSSVKVALLDIESGKCVSSSTNPQTEAPIKSAAKGWAEQDPQSWWNYMCQGIREMAKDHDLSKVVSIGISYQMHGLVALGAASQASATAAPVAPQEPSAQPATAAPSAPKREPQEPAAEAPRGTMPLVPVRDAIIWCDSRAVGIGAQALEEIGYDKCMSHLLNSPGNFTASKLAWVKQNEPETYARIKKFMLPGDYIAYRLTGEVTTTATGLSEGIMWDFQNNCRADFVAENFGIDSSLFCDIVPALAPAASPDPTADATPSAPAASPSASLTPSSTPIASVTAASNAKTSASPSASLTPSSTPIASVTATTDTSATPTASAGATPNAPAAPTASATAAPRTTAAIEQLLGIPAGTPVSYRAGDQPNNAFSLNVLKPGEIAATGGTSGVVYGVTELPKADPKSRVNTFLHVSPGDEQRMGILLCINGTGILNAWCRRNITPELSYSEMNALSETVPVGSDGLIVLPFGNGAERVLENRNIGARFIGLDLVRHTKAHILRAEQEGIAFSFKYGIDIMKDLGLKPDVIRAGKANTFLNPVFRTTLATITGARIELYDTDGALGAARGAALGAGIYSTAEEAFATLEKVEVVNPEPSWKAPLDEAYARWKRELETILSAQ